MAKGKRIISAFEYYKGSARDIAHRIKSGDADAIREGARVLARLLPRNATIVPIPNRSGKAVTTLSLADEIGKYRKDVIVLDALVGTERTESLYTRKQRGEKVRGKELGYKTREGVEIPKNAFLVDNVYDTGITFKAASRASGIKNLLTYASPNKRVKSVYDENGEKRKGNYAYNGLVKG